MGWNYRFDKKAVKDLQKLTKLHQKRILQAIAIVAKNPYRKHNQIKRLSGSLGGYFRLRIGNFRVLYLLDQDDHTIYIKAVLPRNEKTYKDIVR
jgi:mRNA interferase RelE/StbE